VCALKLSESQLIASEAAAAKRADAAALRAQRLHAALDAAAARLSEQQRLWRAAAPGGDGQADAGAAAQVAEATARAVAAERRAYALQDSVLQLQQVGGWARGSVGCCGLGHLAVVVSTRVTLA
jgi:hypothetical protein